MQSYKQWKTLNESFGVTLGLGTQQNMGLSSPFGTFGNVSETKKKTRGTPVEVDVEGEEGWDDLEEDCGCKKSAKKSAKKSSKKSAKKSSKNMDSDMGGDFKDDGEPHKDDEEDDNHEDDDKDDEEGGDDHDEEGGDDHDDEGDEDHDEGDDKDDKGDDEGDEDDDKDDDEDEGDEEKKGTDKKAPPMDMGPMMSSKKSAKKSSKKSAKKSSKKSGKKMHKENVMDEAGWWRSVQGMLGPKTDTKYRDGWSEYQEDSLFTPITDDQMQQATRPPQPGEVGFAPSGRMDNGFDSGMSLGEAVKRVAVAVENAGPKTKAKLARKLTEMVRQLNG